MTKRPSILDSLHLVLSLALMLAVAGAVVASAQQRTPTGSSSSSSSATRVAVPRASAPSAPAPRATQQPTARDTRSYPVGDYKRGGGHRPPGSGGSGGHVGFYFNYHYPYWGGWGPYWNWWGPAWGWWGPSWGYPPVHRVSYVDSEMGGLRLKIKPKRAQVFLDGELIGSARDFDGWPSFLWLEKGTYQLTFFREGYRTLTTTYSVRPGLVLDVRLRMEKGESTPPPRVVRTPTPAVSAPEPSGELAESAPGELAEPRMSAEAERDLRGEPGRLQLRVDPLDASVYLDGRLLGSGKELARLHSSLLVDPGPHVLEVVRPGFRSKKLDFSVEAGQDLALEVELSEG